MKPGIYKARLKMFTGKTFFLFDLEHHLVVDENGIHEPFFIDTDCGTTIEFNPPREWDKRQLNHYHVVRH